MVRNVAINGFGRIGRMVCRRIFEENQDLRVVAINASYDAETLAHLLKYDSVHGRFALPVVAAGDHLIINGQQVRLVADRDPARLPWRELDIDLVIEATGKFRTVESAAAHLEAGAKKVIITAPAKGAAPTFVYGINHNSYDPDRDHVVSAASCTTTALAPVAKVLHEVFGIESGLMTTVHAYTNDQNLVDNPHKDLRRARSAAGAIVPTSTGAAKAVGLVLPELKGKLTGMALRVPTPNVSLVDLTVRLAKDATAQEINAALEQAATGSLAGVLGVSHEPLVSVDYVHEPLSAVVDAPNTMVGPDRMAKVVAWYDNEWGYSCRVVDLAVHMARKIAGLPMAGD
jgi:glyceraldehyde 3-phosphate dehydrogenase